MTWAELCKLGLTFPEGELGTSWGTPAIKARGHLLARLKEDGESVVFMVEDLDEQQMLCETRPATFYITDHYRGYPAVVARLAKLRVAEARERLGLAWGKCATLPVKKERKAKAGKAKAKSRSQKRETGNRKLEMA